MKSRGNQPTGCNQHFVVDGRSVSGVTAAFHGAQERGFTGSWSTIHKRLLRGVNSWAELAAPAPPGVRKGGQIGGKARAEKRQASRAEMAELMKAVDARRSAIASSYGEEE